MADEKLPARTQIPDFRRFHRVARSSAASKACSARGSIGELSSTIRPRPKHTVSTSKSWSVSRKQCSRKIVPST